MLATNTITPEIEMKAMEYIASGYQQILTFECASGGFNWWEGDDPGNAVLSALVMMMFGDTKLVYDTVDDAVSQRTATYLASVQQSDGSWPETTHLHAGNENLGAGSLRATCYIAWGIASAGYEDSPVVQSALGYIKSNLSDKDGDYTRAMCANALAAAGDNSSLLTGILSDLHDAAIEVDGTVHWSPGGDTLVNSGGNAAEVEMTALTILAMAEMGMYPQDIGLAVEWLVQSKDPQGNWGYNTQATVLALKAFIVAATSNPGTVAADVVVRFNGEEIATRQFDDFNKDVVWQVELLEGFLPEGNTVELDYDGIGALSYQIVSTHHIPWADVTPPEGALTIDVDYDATTVAVDDTITATVTITNNDPEAQGMVLVTVGLPPGFDLLTDELNAQKEAGVISLYEVTGKQLILYVDELPAGETTAVTYGLAARYPVKADTGTSEVKLYYDAEQKAQQGGILLEITP
jgi:alpha-2-macroglobulin-like protein